jgi:hypothetical protein
MCSERRVCGYQGYHAVAGGELLIAKTGSPRANKLELAPPTSRPDFDGDLRRRDKCTNGSRLLSSIGCRSAITH